MSNEDSERPAACVMPLHAINGGQKRGRGRPRKEVPDHTQTMAERDAHVSQDELVQSLSTSKQDSISALRGIQLRIAQEAAVLEFDRQHLAKQGKDTQMLSSRRVSALKEVAELEAKIRLLKDEGVIDLHDEKVQKLFQFWITTIQEVAAEVLPQEQSDVFLNALITAMESWEERASALVR